MKYWDSLPQTDQARLRSFQLSREEEWKHEVYAKYKECIARDGADAGCFRDALEEHVHYFGQALQAYIERSAEEQGRLPDWVAQVMTLGYDAIAYVVVKTVFDKSMYVISSSAQQDDFASERQVNLPTAQDVARTIADDVVMLKQWISSRYSEPQFYRSQTRFFKNWDNRRRKAFIKKVNTWDEPSRAMKDKFGHAMLRLAAEYELIELINLKQYTGKKGKVRYTMHVMLNEQLTAYIRQRAEDWLNGLSPVKLPMVCQPVKWDSNNLDDPNGGFMDFTIRDDMRKRKDTDKHISDEQWKSLDGTVGQALAYGRGTKNHKGYLYLSKDAERLLNTMQDVEWRINERVLEVMQHFYDSGIAVGSAPSPENTIQRDFGPRPDKQEDPDGYTLWMNQRINAHAAWARNENDRMQHSLRLREANKLKSFVIWHAYFFDFRGRFYSNSYLLHPQGADLDKALIYAAQGEYCPDPYWVKVNLANLFGVDKCSFDDRVKWVDNNMELWRMIDKDPCGTRGDWEDDAPKKNASFQRLAAIFDLIEVVDGSGYTHVPVQMDGSCNGIQHWAALTRDETIGPEVNLTPSDKPRDVYQLVANRCTDLAMTPDDHGWHSKFLAHYEGCIPRGVCKRSVMCDPYGIKPHSVKRYVMQEKHMAWAGDEQEQRFASSVMGNLICTAKDEAMVHCNHGKQFVQLLSGWVLSETERLTGEPKVLSWQTPLGFIVPNIYNEQDIKAEGVRIWDKDFIGAVNYKLQFGNYNPNKLDENSIIQAMPPNYVHSLDAAHMGLTTLRMVDYGIEFFSMIHDSYGVLAPFVPMLRDATKETFYEIHVQDQLQLLLHRAEELVGKSLPEQHPAWEHYRQRGSLDIREVLESEYLFG